MANPQAGPAHGAGSWGPGKINSIWGDWRGRLARPGKLNLIGSDWWKRYQAGRITAGLLYLDGCDKADFRGASMI